MKIDEQSIGNVSKNYQDLMENDVKLKRTPKVVIKKLCLKSKKEQKPKNLVRLIQDADSCCNLNELNSKENGNGFQGISDFKFIDFNTFVNKIKPKVIKLSIPAVKNSPNSNPPVLKIKSKPTLVQSSTSLNSPKVQLKSPAKTVENLSPKTSPVYVNKPTSPYVLNTLNKPRSPFKFGGNHLISEKSIVNLFKVSTSPRLISPAIHGLQEKKESDKKTTLRSKVPLNYNEKVLQKQVFQGDGIENLLPTLPTLKRKSQTFDFNPPPNKKSRNNDTQEGTLPQVCLVRSPIATKKLAALNEAQHIESVLNLPPLHTTCRSKAVYAQEHLGYVNIVLGMSSIKLKRPTIKHSNLLLYNFLTIKSMKELANVLKQAEQNNDLKSVLLSSTGPVFCSGLDPWMLLEIISSSDDAYLEDLISSIKELMTIIINFKKPLIGCIRGPAVGFGASLLLHCDAVYASETTELQWPYLQQGLPPDGAASYLLPSKANENLANMLLLSGETLTAEKGRCSGLINDVFKHDNLNRHVFAHMSDLCKGNKQDLLSMKKLLNQKKKKVLNAVEKECKNLKEALSNKKGLERQLSKYIKENIAI